MINQFGFSSPSKPWNDSTPHAFLHRMQISRLKERFLKFSKTEQKEPYKKKHKQLIF